LEGTLAAGSPAIVVLGRVEMGCTAAAGSFGSPVGRNCKIAQAVAIQSVRMAAEAVLVLCIQVVAGSE